MQYLQGLSCHLFCSFHSHFLCISVNYIGKISSTLLSKQALFRVSLPLLQVKAVSLPTKMYCMIRKGVNS